MPFDFGGGSSPTKNTATKWDFGGGASSRKDEKEIPVDLGVDPEVSDLSLTKWRAKNPIVTPPTAGDVFTPEGGFIAPQGGEKLWQKGDAPKVAMQAAQVPYNLGFRGGPETDFVVPEVEPPSFTPADMRTFQAANKPVSPLGKVAGFVAEEAAKLPFYALSEATLGAPLAAKFAPKLGAKVAPYASSFMKGFGMGAPVETALRLGEGEPLPDALKSGAASGAMFGGANVAFRGAGELLKGAFKPKVEMPKVEMPVPEMRPPQPQPPPSLPKVGLTREGSISAAKFTVPPKMAEVGDGTRVRSFGVTGMNSPITHPDTKAGLLMESMEGGAGTYKRISHAQTEAGAKRYLADEGLEKSIDYVLHSPDVSARKTGVGKEVIVELQNQGRIDKAIDVYESLAEQLTRAGQEIEAVKLFNALTPEGVTMKATKDAKKGYDALPEPTKQKHKKATDDVQQAFDVVNKEAVEEVIENVPGLKKPRKQSTPKEGQSQKPQKPKEDTSAIQLAARIKRHVTTAEGKDDPIKDMVSTLFKKAREVLPKQSKRVPRDEMELITEAIADKERYKTVWDEAKKVLQQKYGDNPGIMASIESYIDHFINIPYSEAAIGKITRQGIKDEGIDLAQLVRQHYTVQTKTGGSLVEKLVDVGGMSKQDAQVLAMEIGTKFEQIASKKKQQILDQMFRQRLIPAKKTVDQRIIELSNMGALSKGMYRRLIAEKMGLPVLTESMAKQLKQLAETAQTTTGRQSDVARAKIRNILAELKPVSTGQKVDAIRRSAMLLNPKTLGARNIGGNTILGLFENIKDIPGSLADMATTAYLKKKGVNASRTTLMPSLEGAKSQVKGMVKGAKLVVDDIRQGVDTAPRGQYEIPIGKTFRGDGLLSRVANAVDQATTRGLQFGDRPFYQAAYDDALRQQMKIHKVTEPTAEMEAFAQKVGYERTFQNDSEISNAISYLRRGINKIGAGFGLGSEKFGIGNIAVPFAKTPGNIMDKAVDYSPVGFLRAVKEVYRGRKGGDFNQKQFVDAIGRAVTGTGTILLGYDLAKSGVITGQQDKSSKVAAFLRNVGQNAYSYNMSAATRLINGQDPTPQRGDVIRTYDFAQPISVALAIGADIYAGNKDRKAASNVVVEAVKSGGNTLMKQSVLQGLQKMMGGYDVMQNVVDTIFQAPLQFTPALGGQIAKQVDSSARETYSPEIFAGIANKAKARLPGLSQSLPVKSDTLGRGMPSVQGGNSAWNTFLNPGTTRTYDPTPVEQKIIDVYRQTGNADILPRVADKSITVSGAGTIQLTTEEYARYQKRLGELTSEKFNIINTSDPEAASKKMVSALNDADEQARKEILQARGYQVVKKGSGIAVK